MKLDRVRLVNDTVRLASRLSPQAQAVLYRSLLAGRVAAVTTVPGIASLVATAGVSAVASALLGYFERSKISRKRRRSDSLVRRLEFGNMPTTDVVMTPVVAPVMADGGTVENDRERKRARSSNRRYQNVPDLANLGKPITDGLVPKLMYHGCMTVKHKGGGGRRLPVGILQSTNWRFQSVNRFGETNGSLSLGMTGDKAGTSLDSFTYADMPLYAFNLTSAPFGTMTNSGTGVSLGVQYTIPFYRMRKTYTGVAGSMNYSWEVQKGRYNQYDGYVDSATWQFEKKSDKARKYDAPVFHQFKHHYTKVDMSILGAVANPTRVRVMVVKFKTDHNPRRCYNSSNTGVTGTAYDGTYANTLTGDQRNKFDAFYDRMFSDTVMEVMHKTTVPPGLGRPYTVLAYKDITLCNLVTSDVNTSPCRCLFSVMHRDGGIYLTGTDASRFDAENIRAVSGTPFDAPDGHAFGFTSEGLADVDAKPNVFPQKTGEDIWLLVQGMGQNIVGFNGTPGSGAGSFDFVARGKWTTQGQNT